MTTLCKHVSFHESVFPMTFGVSQSYREGPFIEHQHLFHRVPPCLMTDIQADTYLSVLLTVQVIVGIGHHQLLQTKRSFPIAEGEDKENSKQIDTAVVVSSFSLLNCEAQHPCTINLQV